MYAGSRRAALDMAHNRSLLGGSGQQWTDVVRCGAVRCSAVGLTGECEGSALRAEVGEEGGSGGSRPGAMGNGGGR